MTDQNTVNPEAALEAFNTLLGQRQSPFDAFAAVCPSQLASFATACPSPMALMCEVVAQCAPVVQRDEMTTVVRRAGDRVVRLQAQQLARG